LNNLWFFALISEEQNPFEAPSDGLNLEALAKRLAKGDK